MNIIPAHAPLSITHLVFCIFGQPGIGKTTLGYSANDPLLLDFDAGAHRAANRRDTLQVQTWADALELSEQPTALDPYATLVVDTAGRCLDLLGDHISQMSPKLAHDGALTLQGWARLKGEFRQWLTRLRGMQKNVVLLCHHREEKDNDLIYVRPDLQGASFGEVIKNADFVAYLYMHGRDRILDFSPTDRWFGKNPASWAPLKMPPVDKATGVLASLIAKGREALGQMSAASNTIAIQVHKWQTVIDTFTTAEEHNLAIGEIKKLSATVRPQVAKLLLDHGSSIGIPFDKARRQFEVPAPPQSPELAATDIVW